MRMLIRRCFAIVIVLLLAACEQAAAELEVPGGAGMLHLQFFLFGPGQLWVSGLRLDVVQ